VKDHSVFACRDKPGAFTAFGHVIVGHWHAGADDQTT
jgi:hypothetical protein